MSTGTDIVQHWIILNDVQIIVHKFQYIREDRGKYIIVPVRRSMRQDNLNEG